MKCKNCPGASKLKCYNGKLLYVSKGAGFGEEEI